MHTDEAAAKAWDAERPRASIARSTSGGLRARAGCVRVAGHLRPSLFLTSYLVLLLTLTPGVAADTNRLTKLSPEPVVVQMEDGAGTTNLIFALAKGAELPLYRVTAAVGSSNSIPAEQITFNWDAAPGSQSTVLRTVIVGRLSVRAVGLHIEQETNYAGRIIFYWADAEQSFDFTVSDRTSVVFSLTAQRLDLTVNRFQPDTASVRVKNTGKAGIRRLSISSSDLLDGETQRRVLLPEVFKDFGAMPLAPGHEAEVSFTIPQLDWAGTYTGTLDVVADGRSHQSIPLMLRGRGPVPGRYGYFVPFVLFVATLLLGFVLSNKLENWFNLGGLQRAEALLSLQRSERELARVSDQVDAWGATRPPQVFATTKIWLRQTLDDLRGLFARVQELSREQLVSEAQRFATAATLAGIFESAVKAALALWPDPSQQGKLNGVLTELDRVTRAAEPQPYRENLRAVLEKNASEGASESDDRALYMRGALPDVPPPAELAGRIERMARLQRLVVAAVVFIVAYQLFYARDFSFGTLLDYLQVFLWSLGLTQTGAQILARARSSFTPSQ